MLLRRRLSNCWKNIRARAQVLKYSYGNGFGVCEVIYGLGTTVSVLSKNYKYFRHLYNESHSYILLVFVLFCFVFFSFLPRDSMFSSYATIYLYV